MYVRRTSAAKVTNDSGTSIQGRNAAALCKPIYTGIHLRRTICVSKEAMERLPLSNPGGSLMARPWPYLSSTAAQHFESENFTFRNRFGRAASQDVGCGEEREARYHRSHQPKLVFQQRLFSSLNRIKWSNANQQALEKSLTSCTLEIKSIFALYFNQQYVVFQCSEQNIVYQMFK
ncbi:Hypothetical_protein [Hexamita inflata]|uniref:Hypothetical_protein n=1 Tax=Hexamita inflata TaxID=28002 RepID=A0AA86TJ14_9EUKA|nr:Hypothetical protein HINF_LOCUS2193 [Hexamita inflata]